jgi:signal transduction histidine kinase
MAAIDDEIQALADELEAMAERLADLALDRLRAAVDPDDATGSAAEAEERRLTRARRAVKRAADILRPTGRDDPGLLGP